MNHYEKNSLRKRAVRSFLVIGVTGGIGTGKSTVSGMLQERGARLLDADALSRQVTEPGMPALGEISSGFGEDLIDFGGRLDRTRLASEVFTDPVKRRELEAIVHRRVVEAIDRFLAQWQMEGYRGFAVLDVPIPVERGFLDNCDEVWVVESPQAQRVQRVRKRSGLSETDVLVRMSVQPDEEAYRGLATRLLANEGSLEELKCEVFHLLELALHDAHCGQPHACGKGDSGDKLGA